MDVATTALRIVQLRAQRRCLMSSVKLFKTLNHIEHHGSQIIKFVLYRLPDDDRICPLLFMAQDVTENGDVKPGYV